MASFYGPGTPSKGSPFSDWPYTLGGEVEFAVDGEVSAIRFWRETTNDDIDFEVAIYENGNTVALAEGSATVVAADSNQWIVIDLDSAVSVTAGNLYVIAVHYQFPQGQWQDMPVDATKGTSERQSGDIIFPADGANNGQGRYAQSGSVWDEGNAAGVVYPTITYNSEMYLVDVVFDVPSTGAEFSGSATTDSATGAALAAFGAPGWSVSATTDNATGAALAAFGAPGWTGAATADSATGAATLETSFAPWEATGAATTDSATGAATLETSFAPWEATGAATTDSATGSATAAFGASGWSVSVTTDSATGAATAAFGAPGWSVSATTDSATGSGTAAFAALGWSVTVTTADATGAATAEFGAAWIGAATTDNATGAATATFGAPGWSGSATAADAAGSGIAAFAAPGWTTAATAADATGAATAEFLSGFFASVTTADAAGAALAEFAAPPFPAATPERRTFIVPAESRAMRVLPESRRFQV